MEENAPSADDIIVTHRLSERLGRAPDYAAENRALEALATELAEHPENLLQKLVDTIVEMRIGDSAGISIEEKAGVRQFRWVALAGVWSQLRGSTIPFDSSPCGLAVRRDQLLLIESPERFFAEARVEPLIHEGMLLPFHVEGRPVGTLWVNAHNPTRKFDTEDARLLKSLARFAAAGFRTVQALEEAQAGRSELEQRVAAQVAELEVSEEKYRILFETMGQGFIELEVMHDEHGRPVDLHYLELNPAFERQFGVSVAQARGKRASEFFPDFDPAWTDLFDRVARTGTPERIEEALAGRWFEVFAYPGTDSRVMALYEDISERKQAEANSALLASIADDLARLIEPDDIIQSVGVRLGEALDLSLYLYCDVDEKGDEVTVHPSWQREEVLRKQTYRIADFLTGEFARSQRAGETFVVCDTVADERTDAAAYALISTASIVAVPFHRDGKWVACLAVTGATPRDWKASEIAIVQEVAERVFPRVERARAESALQQSEEKFRTVFETIDHAFLIQEIIRDDAGLAIDMRYLEINPGFTRQTGLGPEIVGKLVSEVMPDVERFFIDIHDRVARTGVPERFEQFNQSTGRWYDAYITPLGGQGRLTASVFEDVSARKLAEIALRESEERQAFLLELSDALRPLADPAAIQGEATRQLLERLGLSRCWYSEFDDGNFTVLEDAVRDGLPSLVGTHDFSDCPEYIAACLAGQALAVPDIVTSPLFSERVKARYAPLGARAALLYPLVKDGELISVLSAVRDEARPWPEWEVGLVGEVAERTWAAVERARAEAALRESEERFRSFAETSSDTLWIIGAESGRLEYLSPAYEKMWGEPRDAVMADTGHWASRVHPEDRTRAAEGLVKLRAGERFMQQYRIIRPDGAVRYIQDTGFPIMEEGRVRRLAGVAQDLTDRTLAEQAVARAEYQARTLMEGVPQLVWRAVDGGEWTWASPQWTEFTGQAEVDSHGKGWLDRLHPDDRDAALGAWARAEEAGGFDVEYRLRRSDGEYSWFTTRASPVRDEAGAIVEWLGSSTDIHALRQMQERQGVMVAELQHRTRNLITVVRSLSDRTLGNAVSLGEFKDRFGRRLAALSRVQGLLSQLAAGERVGFDELLRSELTALGALDSKADKVTLDGPAGVPLRSATVQTFALALHDSRPTPSNMVRSQLRPVTSPCAGIGRLLLTMMIHRASMSNGRKAGWTCHRLARRPAAAAMGAS